MSRLRWGLGGALLLTLIVYSRLVFSYFCGFDDFTNQYRAAFEDSPKPSVVLTTTHFGSPKYRPVSRGVVLLCYWLTPDSALAHRLRNLLSHLFAVAFVFAIAKRLGANQSEATFAATLFGLHPLAHQSTAAAIFGVNFAYAFALAALWMFLSAYESTGKRLILLLGGSAICACMALLTYEAAIAVFAMYGVFLLWQWVRKHPPAAGFVPFGVALVLSQALPLAVFFGTRMLFVAERMPLISAKIIAKNVALFASALVLPVDLLLLNSLIGSPLPSELLGDREALLGFAVAGFIAVSLIAVYFIRSSEARRRARDLPWWTFIFLVSGIAFSLAPFLFFTDHASETYTYLPAAFWSIVVAIGISRVAGPGSAGRVLIVAILLLAGAAAWMRTERVRHCAAVADRIVSSVPAETWTSGAKVLFADAPGIIPLNKFGLYNYRGLATIDLADHMLEPLEDAFRLRFHKAEIKATIVSTEQMTSSCTQTDPCFFVDAEGNVSHR